MPSDSALRTPCRRSIAATTRGFLVNIPFVNSGGTYANASEENWRLPLPAVFVVRQDKTIAFSEGYADFRVRPEPSDAMDALAALVPSPHPSR